VRRLGAVAPADARAEALRVRASLLLKLRRTEEAQAALEEILAALPAEAPPAVRGSLLLDSALAMEQGGNPDAARARLEDAIRALAGHSRAGEALLALGRLHLRARDLPRAREALEQALEDGRRRGSASTRIEVLTSLSALAQAEGDAERALSLLDEALVLAAANGDGVAEAKARQQVARTQQQLGRHTEALVAAKLSHAVAQRFAWDEGTAVASQLVVALERR
jgi:tetratricopeptide (TPR) repeat protein